MSDFTPGVERMRSAGYTVQAGVYPEGCAGIALSIQELAKKIRDGRLDADVRGWAGDVLIAAGKPTRVRDQVQAILDAFRQQTMYLSDPVAAEYIVSAAGTACLRPGLCVKARDCDDGVVFVGSALMSVGIPVMVLKQYFGPDAPQQHVLLEARDESGAWLSADPSTSDPVGHRGAAYSEERINPMDVVGGLGTKGQEIVTLGAIHVRERDVHFDGRVWRERRWGRDYEHDGSGWREVSRVVVEELHGGRWTPVGLGQAPAPATAPTPWQTVTDGAVKPGLRYRIGFLVNALGTDRRSVDYVAARNVGQEAHYLTLLLQDSWLIESMTRTSSASGGVDSWQMVGISKVDGTMQDDAFFSTTSEEVQASSAPPVEPATPPVVVPKPPPPSGTVSAPTVILTAVGVGVAGGVVWGMLRRKRRRKAA